MSLNLIQDSKDLLYVVIALCVFLFTIFSCWAIYYFARILQQSFKIIKEMRDRLHKIDEIFKTLKDKIEHSTSYLLLIGEGVKKLIEIAKEQSDKWQKKKTTTSKKK